MKRRWTAILMTCCMLATMLPPTAAQAVVGPGSGEVGTDTKIADFADFMDHQELLNGADEYWGGMHGIIYFGKDGDGDARWQIIGKNEQLSQKTGKEIITVSHFFGFDIPFNTEDHVASLSKDSWAEFGCEFVESEREVEIFGGAVGTQAYDNRYPSQLAPPREAWGTSYVRQEFQNMYDTMFSSSERRMIQPMTLYTDIIRSDDGYWVPDLWDDLWDEDEGDFETRYREVYKTEDYLYLPYMADGTMYTGENTADNLTSGETAPYNNDAIPSVADVTRGISVTEIIDVGEQGDDGFDASHIPEHSDFNRDSKLYRVWNLSSSSDHDPYTNTGEMRPFVNLNVTDISFASWVPPVSSEGEVDNSSYRSRSTYMRSDGAKLNLGTATISPDMSSVAIENLSSSATRRGTVYLVVQYRGKDASEKYYDDKAYAKKVTSGDVITASELTDGAIVDFENTEVWLEWQDITTDDVYGVRATVEEGGGDGGFGSIGTPGGSDDDQSFADVNENDWFSEAVAFVSEFGLMTGTGENEFSPNTATTRGMLVSILNRLAGGPTGDSGGFSDVEEGAWYEDAVNWAASQGIVAGFEDGTFRPNEALTREQTAAILYNFAQWQELDVSASADISGYSDAASVSDWASEALAWAFGDGLLAGMPENQIDPQGNAVRAQIAAILQRFLAG